jgi:hypothetical protein
MDNEIVNEVKYSGHLKEHNIDDNLFIMIQKVKEDQAFQIQDHRESQDNPKEFEDQSSWNCRDSNLSKKME